MPVRIAWDQYEAALLLEYCIRVEDGRLLRTEAVSTVSQALRKRAVKKGFVIDEIFRNENGISMQMAAMRNCYLGKEKGLTISKLFRKVVAVYKQDKTAFAELLQEESDIMNESVWLDFLLWLKETYPRAEKETLAMLTLVNVFSNKNKLLQCPLSSVTDKEQIVYLQHAAIRPCLMGINGKKTAKRAQYALGLYLRYLDMHEFAESKSAVESATVSENERIMTVDFSSSMSYSHTKPVSCFYKGNAVKCSGWNVLYINVVKMLYHDETERFQTSISLQGSRRIDIGAADAMVYPKEIANGTYLECNVSATGIVNKLHALMDMLDISYTSIVIQYRSNVKAGTLTERVSMEGRDKQTKSEWIPQYTQQVSQLIAAKYQYGFRIASPIEMMRLRNYAEEGGIALPQMDEELDREIRAAGMIIDGKVFVIEQELLSTVGKLLDSVFVEGVGAVFLKRLYEINADWIDEHHIVSMDMLKELVRRSRPSYYIGKNIITPFSKMTENEAVVKELHRVSDKNHIVGLKELTKQLPYIPDDKIAWTLSYCNDFIRVSEGQFYNMKFFSFNEEDAAAITRYVAETCHNLGYASITDIPLGAIPDENYELPIGALHSAIYEAILRQNYHLNGKILTAEATDVDIKTLLRAYCNGRAECTVTELMDRAIELAGAPYKQYSLITLFDTMIRTDADHFIAETQAQFDVDRIDFILDTIIGTHFAPIRAVTTFALFPPCGLSWNHYLLESYCYRFSRKYRLCVLNYNDKNAGIIAARDLSLTYNDMLCEAAASAEIPLTQEAIGNYFFENGYTAKRKYATLPNIIEKADIIREER